MHFMTPWPFHSWHELKKAHDPKGDYFIAQSFLAGYYINGPPPAPVIGTSCFPTPASQTQSNIPTTYAGGTTHMAIIIIID